MLAELPLQGWIIHLPISRLVVVFITFDNVASYISLASWAGHWINDKIFVHDCITLRIVITSWLLRLIHWKLSMSHEYLPSHWRYWRQWVPTFTGEGGSFLFGGRWAECSSCTATRDGYSRGICLSGLSVSGPGLTIILIFFCNLWVCCHKT